MTRYDEKNESYLSIPAQTSRWCSSWPVKETYDSGTWRRRPRDSYTAQCAASPAHKRWNTGTPESRPHTHTRINQFKWCDHLHRKYESICFPAHVVVVIYCATPKWCVFYIKSVRTSSLFSSLIPASLALGRVAASTCSSSSFSKRLGTSPEFSMLFISSKNSSTTIYTKEWTPVNILGCAKRRKKNLLSLYESSLSIIPEYL